MSNDDNEESWAKQIEEHFWQESDKSYDPETELFLVLELNSDRVIGLTISIIPLTCHVAFTTLENLKSFMKNLIRIGVFPSGPFRVFPTTIDEYASSLKEEFGGFDLFIDPPDDYELTDKNLHIH